MTPVPALVPRRSDHGWRDELWAWCRPRWEAVGLTIVEGHDDTDGPFNRSRALNRAASDAGPWDVAVIIDADIIAPDVGQIDQALDVARATGQLTLAYDRRRNLDRPISQRLLRGWPVTVDGHVRTELPIWPASPSCSSALVVTRDLWDTVGGFDERFAGWGWDDVGFHRSCITLAGGQQSVPGDLLHLWHSRPAERHGGNELLEANRALGERYKAAQRANDPDAIRSILHEPGGPLA